MIDRPHEGRGDEMREEGREGEHTYTSRKKRAGRRRTVKRNWSLAETEGSACRIEGEGCVCV